VVACRFEVSSELEQARTRLSPAAACASGSGGGGRALELDCRGRRAGGVGCGLTEENSSTTNSPNWDRKSSASPSSPAASDYGEGGPELHVEMHGGVGKLVAANDGAGLAARRATDPHGTRADGATVALFG
jgi:hypothetical protein